VSHGLTVRVEWSALPSPPLSTPYTHSFMAFTVCITCSEGFNWYLIAIDYVVIVAQGVIGNCN